MAYAGDVTARQAWEQLSADRRSVLVDVRTPAEWNYVGVPDLSAMGKSLLRVAWQGYPGLQGRPAFLPLPFRGAIACGRRSDDRPWIQALLQRCGRF